MAQNTPAFLVIVSLSETKDRNCPWAVQNVPATHPTSTDVMYRKRALGYRKLLSKTAKNSELMMSALFGWRMATRDGPIHEVMASRQ